MNDLAEALRDYRAYRAEFEYLCARLGVLETVAEMFDDRVEAGEPVSGAWIIGTIDALAVEAGIPEMCV